MKREEHDTVSSGMNMTDEQYRAALRQFARVEELHDDSSTDPDQIESLQSMKK